MGGVYIFPCSINRILNQLLSFISSVHRRFLRAYQGPDSEDPVPTLKEHTIQAKICFPIVIGVAL